MHQSLQMSKCMELAIYSIPLTIVLFFALFWEILMCLVLSPTYIEFIGTHSDNL